MPEGCIEWRYSRDVKGYGIFNSHGRSMKAHRRAWELAFGKIPEGMCVLHKCDNPPCCNIEHLFLGTKKDNAHDAIRKGRQSVQVQEIRKLSGLKTQWELANRFSVNQSTISRIQSNKRWKELWPIKY